MFYCLCGFLSYLLLYNGSTIFLFCEVDIFAIYPLFYYGNLASIFLWDDL